MSGIFGIVRRDGSPVPDQLVTALNDAMRPWAPAGSDVWRAGPAVLAQARSPMQGAPPPVLDDGVVVAAAGRLDDRRGLSDPELAAEPDESLIRTAYIRWGSAAPTRLLGDWAFAAWHPEQRRLILARDHFGVTALYYHADRRLFAFASSRRALLALGLAGDGIDELYLAQVLVSWPAYHGGGTIHPGIRRLPPAHRLTVTAEGMSAECYWRPEDTPTLLLSDRAEYGNALREVFDRAVETRLRNAGNVATTLSGGLDSGSVAATAAGLLSDGGGRLLALTSVPRFDPTPYASENIGDELPLARATAASASNIDLVTVDGTSLTPIQAIRRGLAVHQEPGHAAGSLYWIIDLLETARARGCRVLLTGQMGNGGLSWSGDPLSQPLAYQVRALGLAGMAKAQIRRRLPAELLATARRRRVDPDWYRASAIHPAFARRLDLLERRLQDPAEVGGQGPLQQRLSILKPGRSFGGGTWAEFGTEFGLDVRDPTADACVVALALSIPDQFFIDPATGLDRWLVREAMKGRLPDSVRLNHRRGLQAADLVPRLRASATEVDAALGHLAAGPAAAYVDVGYMADVWRMVQTHDTPAALRKAVTVLTRGIMAGLFVNGLAA